MGCGDCVAQCCASSILMRIALFICYAAFILELVAFGTPMWFEFEYAQDVPATIDPVQKKGGTGYQGLWNHCYRHNDYMCCGTVSEYMSNSSNSTPDWMKAVRAMLIISLVASILTIIAIQAMVSYRSSKGLSIVALILVIFTAVFLGCTVITYAAGIRDESWTTNVTYGFSFMLVLFSGIGFIAVAVLIVFGLCCLSLGSAIDSVG